MQNDDRTTIQVLDDSDNHQVPNNIHHILVYNINSFNTHDSNIQDSGNNHGLSNCWSPLTDHQLYLTKRGHLSDQLLQSQHLEQPLDQLPSPNSTLTLVPLVSDPLHYILLSSLTTAFFCLIFVVALHIGPR